MKIIYLEDLWRGRLRNQQWSDPAIEKFLLQWALSMLNSYSYQASNFKNFCNEVGYSLDKVPSYIVVKYFTQVAEALVRPKPLLNTNSAVIKCMYNAMDLQSPMSQEVSSLINGLVKSGTVKLIEKSMVLPRKPFVDMFNSWPDNMSMNLESLR